MGCTTNRLLAWQPLIQDLQHLSIETSNATSQGSLQGRAARHLRHVSRNLDYEVREVAGDRDCFFHAVKTKDLTRKNLVKQLINHAGEEEVRIGFAAEIRQFIIIGFTTGHEDKDEQQAYERLNNKEVFQRLHQRLVTRENELQKLTLDVREFYGEKITQGMNHAALLTFLKRKKAPHMNAFSEALKKVKAANAKVTEHCQRQDVFENYVREYLETSRGFIPLAQRIHGESFKTPIDIINNLFQVNIQVFLERDGALTRVTEKREGAYIPILHNGIDHFSGLTIPGMPLQIDQVIEQMPSDVRPADFSMFHSLQAGFLGTHYQILVLLEKVTRLLVSGTSFQASMEAKNHGNLDDIIIAIKDAHGQVQQLEAFQVKHHNEPIAAKLFVNNEEGKAKGNVEMHIGKFLDGWLQLKKEHPKIKNDHRKSIIFSNAGLDDILEQCVQGGRFSEEFIKRTKIVFLNGRINKGKDFYQTMYKQAQEYLRRKFPETQFAEFLQSFEFRLGQKEIKPLTESIINNLSKCIEGQQNQTDQLFLNLFYAICEWFGHNSAGERETPFLTNEVLNRLLKRACIHFHDSVFLKGITQSALENIQSTCEGLVVERKEQAALEKALTKPGLILVTGEKGIGKSGLVKQILLKLNQDQYLFLSAKSLLKDPSLTKKCSKILKQEASTQVMVIDSAEILLSLKPAEREKFLDNFVQKRRTVVLTLTHEAARQISIPFKHSVILIEPLTSAEVVKTFPQLQPYKMIEAVMRLACLPFHLNIMLKVISQSGKDGFERLLKTKNLALEAELVSQVVQGRNEQSAKERKKVWRNAAIKIAKSSNPEPDKHLTKYCKELINEQILLDYEGNINFSHDLFFEHGLMDYWLKEWNLWDQKDDTASFWTGLPETLQFHGSISVLSKWFILHRSKIKPDLLSHIEKLSKHPVLESLIALAIVLEDRDLLSEFHKTAGSFNSFKVQSGAMLAIALDSSQALEALFKLADAAQDKKEENIESDREIELQESVSSDESSTNESEKSSSFDSDDEYSGSEGYSLGSHSSSESSDEESRLYFEDDDVNSPLEEIQSLAWNNSVNKYWSAGFHEEPDFSDEEGNRIVNERFEQSPQNDTSYIHFAVINGAEGCLKIILEHEPTLISHRNNVEETALHLSVLKKSKSMTQLLLDAEAPIHAKDKWGETPLHNAAYAGNIEIAQLLLELKANPNELNKAGLSPLHIAFARLDLNMVQLLVDNKGDLAIRPFRSEKETISDLLDYLPLQSSNPEQQKCIDQFVLALIDYLHFGEEDPAVRAIVEDLITLAENAQLSEASPGFDYYDSETELEYTIETDHSKIDDMTDTILNCPDRIALVLQSKAFKHMKKDLVENWFNQASEQQHQNLKTYAEEHGDQETLNLIYVSDSD